MSKQVVKWYTDLVYNADYLLGTPRNNENTIIVANLITKKDRDITPRNNPSQILDFVVSPINKMQEDSSPVRKRGFFPSKNNPTYKEGGKKDSLPTEEICWVE